MFILPVRVYYEDTDAGGVVYYANYLKFMERARTEWLRTCGYEQNDLICTQNLLFAVRAVSLEYLKPARFNDLLHVGVGVNQVKRASIVFEQSVARPLNEGQADLLTKGHVVVVSIDARTFKPTPIPKTMKKDLESAG